MSDRKRPYRKTKRAELEEDTRRRITESAVALHAQLGPARTSMSAIAEHAGVPRSTLYRHFPDDAAMFAACSAHWTAANPPPDPSGWPAIADPAERTHAALAQLYAYYGRTEQMMGSLLRDEPLVPVVAELFGGYHAYLTAIADMLMAGRGLRGRARQRTRAAIGHALAFATWRSLVREQGLGEADAVALMERLVATSAGT
jgi:AcrR family transcriptional regulator